ncbi:DIL domain-containing protein [Phanerochaete sordida]|uniref:DIL domain-containing protein n=1 Tax=Phanerochaete sordida TaxID=48140 RepID=A0A9P3L9G7_9APHY|nr:DIL domain-containing protein [Phanerochaete sordida]
MASTSLNGIDLTVEPDLQPLYPTPSLLSHLLSPNVGLSPGQKTELVNHCLTRACVFGDLTLLSYLLSDPHAQPFLDLGKQDEDGLGLISTTILGFGSGSDRDVKREECVRLLIAEGADVTLPDQAGWISLHHAALLAPPTLVSHLLTHGCSPFATTRRNLTALDIVTAHTLMPGREDMRVLLEEAMREQGWTGGRMEERRRADERKMELFSKFIALQESVGRILDVGPAWWGDADADSFSDTSDDEDEAMPDEEKIFTPSPDYTSMLVFAPHSLPDIFQTLIIDFKPRMKNAEPANALYMLSRFACLNCDDHWLEDLVIGATDAIEDTFFNRGDDLSCLVFWLYNVTVWLHLMRCDEALKETCEMLGSYTLIEEILNSVFVFIIRFAERRIDGMLDAAFLEYSPLSNEFDSVQFESEWSILRTFQSSKKKPAPLSSSPAPGSPVIKSTVTPNSAEQSRPPTPPSTAQAKFASLRQTFGRSRPPSGALGSVVANDAPPAVSPHDVTSFMTALHTLLTLADINPSLIVQLWSQVTYWAACEVFNRILTRKKFLCRSRAVQISMNIGVIDEWISTMELPRGVGAHFAPVKDLLNWLQCSSSITEFADLIATIQTMRHINPLQMRRAVRDYKYEVNEGRMTEECTQYLAQLQKDWERHRVKMGVEALRREMGERERERTEDTPSLNGSYFDSTPPSPSAEYSGAQRGIDALFDRTREKSSWEPPPAPEALGELMDSRHMLPLLLPSDPRLLGAAPAKTVMPQTRLRSDSLVAETAVRSSSRASHRASEALAWRLRTRKLREVEIRTLQWIDGAPSTARWYRPVEFDEEEEKGPPPAYAPGEEESLAEDGKMTLRLTPLTSSRLPRNRGRQSTGATPIDAPSDVPMGQPTEPAPTTTTS